MQKREFLKKIGVGGGATALALGSLGCPTTAQVETWIAQAQSYIAPGLQVLTDILALVVAFAGKSILAPAQVTTLAAIAQLVSTGLGDLAVLISQYAAKAGGTTLGEIQNALAVVQSNMGKLSSDFQSAGPAFWAKAGVIVALLESTVSTIAGFIPPSAKASAVKRAMAFRATLTPAQIAAQANADYQNAVK